MAPFQRSKTAALTQRPTTAAHPHPPPIVHNRLELVRRDPLFAVAGRFDRRTGVGADEQNDRGARRGDPVPSQRGNVGVRPGRAGQSRVRPAVRMAGDAHQRDAADGRTPGARRRQRPRQQVQIDGYIGHLRVRDPAEQRVSAVRVSGDPRNRPL